MRFATWSSIELTFVIVAGGLSPADVGPHGKSEPQLPIPMPILKLQPAADGGLAPTTESLNDFTRALPEFPWMTDEPDTASPAPEDHR